MHADSATTDEYLADLSVWQRTNLAQFRALIHEVYPAISEEIKWGVPVFLIDKKMMFSMAAFKAHTKYNFIGNGALLDDPHTFFNNGLDSKKSRSIDMREGESIDQTALRALIVQAIDKHSPTS